MTARVTSPPARSPEEVLQERARGIAPARRNGRPEVSDDNEETGIARWPAAPARPAYYGLAGRLVDILEPHTEADPAAILAQFIVVVGNWIGGGPHFLTDGVRQHVNEFLLVVGSTSTGRKGSSLAQASGPIEQLDPQYVRDRMPSGLSSGEGLIAYVRDPDPEADEPAMDRRALVVESEFASVLRVAGRDGSTLSPILRKAWDGGPLRSLTKHSPLSATGAHVSIIAHITPGELTSRLDRTEIANGLVNRFLIVAARRSKYLPDGGEPPVAELQAIANELRQVGSFARGVGGMVRDAEARALWHAMYPSLTDRPAGLLGAATSRAAPHVVRLSCIYALLDCSQVVQRPHLEAALALWHYAEESAAFFLGSQLGDPVADALLQALRASPEGLSLTEMYGLKSRHWSREQIRAGLEVLAKEGLATGAKKATGGRPSEHWTATTAANEEKKANEGASDDGLSSLTSLSSLTTKRVSESIEDRDSISLSAKKANGATKGVVRHADGSQELTPEGIADLRARRRTPAGSRTYPDAAPRDDSPRGPRS